MRCYRGRDPNGYVGCMWSICGARHLVVTYRGKDFPKLPLPGGARHGLEGAGGRAVVFCQCLSAEWTFVQVFGKIRFMNYAGCKRCTYIPLCHCVVEVPQVCQAFLFASKTQILN